MRVLFAWLPGRIVGWLDGLRFPVLFLLTAALFVLDLLIPDLVPLMDEVLLGLGTLLFARLRKQRRVRREAVPAGRTDT